ncbi:MAG: phage portal protein [Chloroflexi bacterium]|nr:phage portal protein [Chloroflexota bacterium]
MVKLPKWLSKFVTPSTSNEFGRWIEATVMPQDETRYLYMFNQDMGRFVARYLQWVNICCNLNAGNCAAARIRLYRPTKGPGIRSRKTLARLNDPARVGWKAATLVDGRNVEEVTDHPALSVIRQPSSVMSGHEFARLRFLSKELCGNAFFWCVGDEEPNGIAFLFPQYTGVIASDKTFVDGLMYGRDTANRVKIPQDEVMHFKQQPSMVDPYYGDTWVSAVLAEADLFRYATVSETSRWQNEGRPPMVIKLPETTGKEERRQIIEDINRQIRGIRNSGNPLVTQFSDVKNMGWTNKDMEYIQGMERTERMIWAAAGIPESVLRPNEGSLAAAAAGHPGYMRNAITPRLCLDADDMTNKLLSKFPDTAGWFFAYDDVVPEDRKEQVAEWVSMAASGFMTIDEVRKAMGLEPLPDGLGSVPRVNGTALVLNQTPVQIEEAKHAACCWHESFKPDAKSLAIWTKDDKGDFETAMRMALKTWFQNIINDCAKMVQEQGSITLTGQRVNELNTIITDGTLKAFTAGGIAKEPDFNLPADRVVQVLSRHRATVMEQVTNTTIDDLRTTLSDGIAKGESVAEITQTLSETYPEERAALISRTELGYAFDLGQQAAMGEAGVAFKAWDLAGGPCPLCEKIVGAIISKWGANKVPLDQPFLTTTDMLALGAGKLSRDLYAAKGHPNCRCGTAGIREGESQ